MAMTASPRGVLAALLLTLCPDAMACMEERVVATVRFETDSSVRANDLNDVVIRMREKARQYPDRKVLVMSYVDEKSKEVVANAKGAAGAYARTLGERRGERVKSKLAAVGFNHTIIDVETLTTPQKGCDDPSCRENRVEITLLPTQRDANSGPPEAYPLTIDDNDFKGGASFGARVPIHLPELGREDDPWEIKEAFSRKRGEDWAPLAEIPTRRSQNVFLLWPIPDEMLIVFVRKGRDGQTGPDDVIRVTLSVYDGRVKC